MSKRERMSVRINPFALIAAFGLVTASVVVGVFGPRLTERAQSDLIPLGDVVSVAREMAARLQFDALHRPLASANPTHEQVAALCNGAHLGSWRPRDLSSFGFALIEAQQVSLIDGTEAVAIVYEGTGERTDRFLTVFAAEDHGQFASFDEFGRIEPFAVGRSIVETDELTLARSNATLVWSDGALLTLTLHDDASDLEALRDALGAP